MAAFPAAIQPEPRRRRAFRRWLGRGLLGALAALLVLAALLYWPVRSAGLRTAAQPAASYAEATQRIAALEARTGAVGLHPLCHLRFFTHGQRQPRAIVLVHGYTDCPQQFEAMGQALYAQGYNVLIVPLPQHGEADRLTEAQSKLTAEALAAYGGETLDIAHGLGEHVTMLGLSGGATVTAWVAQTRPDLDEAVMLSPAYGYRQIPTPLTRPAMNLFLLLPNRYEWWDPTLKAEGLPAHGYPRYATRALAQLLRLGEAIQAAARRAAPAAQRLLVVTNAHDDKINNVLTAQVADLWRSHGANLDTYEFPDALQLAHDLIEPEPPDPRTPEVYAQLIEMLEK